MWSSVPGKPLSDVATVEHKTPSLQLAVAYLSGEGEGNLAPQIDT